MPEAQNAPPQHFGKKPSGKRGPPRAAPAPNLDRVKKMLPPTPLIDSIPSLARANRMLYRKETRNR